MRLLFIVNGIFWCTLIFVAMFLPVICLLSWLPFPRRYHLFRPFVYLGSLGLLRLASLAKVTYIDRRLDEQKQYLYPAIYVGNHQSYLDIPLLMIKFQIPPIMKKEVLMLPIVGWVGWCMGGLPVSRGKSGSRRKVFERARNRLVNEKFPLQYYPEGTRSKTRMPKPYSEIKTALLNMAYQENIPVIPLSIYGTRGLVESLLPFRPVGLLIHTAITKEGFSSAEEFSEAIWRKVQLGHDELKSQLKS